MIYTTATLSIKDYESVCDRKIILYRGDKNVEIRFILKGNTFVVKENVYAQMIIKRPSTSSLFSDVSLIENNTVIFTISEDMIDEMKEIGTYVFQIRLYDDNMESRVTLPPCNNSLIIERPVAVENESLVNYAMVNYSVSMSGNSIEEDIFNEDNDYIRTEWMDGDIITDFRLNKIENALYSINRKEGSGTGGSSPYISTSIPEDVIVKTGENFDLMIDFTSPNLGMGTLKVFVNNMDVLSTRIDQGESHTEIGYENFVKGNNTITVYVIDRVGIMSNSLTFYLRYGGLELESSFDAYTAYDQGTTVRYYFTPSSVDTSKELIFYMKVDGILQPGVSCESDIRSFFTFSNSLTAGKHSCEAWISDGENESNRLTFNLILLDDTSLVIASDTKEISIEEGENLSIDYKVYKKGESSFIVKVYEDNKLVSTGTCGLDFNYYKTSALKEGSHTIRIEAYDSTENYTDYIECPVEITASTFSMLTPTVSGSLFIGTARNKTNADGNRDKWIGENQDGNQVIGELNNVTFDSSGGWIDDCLILEGDANAKIPIKPLVNNVKTGFTLDIEFSTKPIGVFDAEVLTLWDDKAECGIKITTEEVIMQSKEGNRCDLYFSEDEIINVMFVIDREEKMAKIYLNGVMCEAFALSDYEVNGVKYYEDFTVDDYIYLNKNNGYSLIKNLRVYEVALTSEEILNNFISLKTTKAEQQALVNFQKGDTLPTLTIYCDFSGLGKDDKKPCGIIYNSPDENLYGKSFSLTGKTSQLQYQGTSSMAYPIKNYRLNLRDENGDKWKYNPFSSGQPEDRFTLKADFMSSGHWQNTGLSKWVNDNLYHYDVNDEKSMNPSKWYDVQNGIPMSAHRESINGFPCRLILINDGETPLNEGQYEPTPGNTKDMGVFNFNNDKDNTDTMGFNTDIFPYCASYEVTANSDTSAGAFMSYKGSNPNGELEYLQQSFELRFPDADDVGDGYGFLDVNGDTSMGLKRVIDWVDNCTDEEFVRDFEQYFHKQYTLRYYLLVIVLGMVDNLGKNMMLDTFDHKVFLPRFYDMDTICSYDNTGQIAFDVDIEMEQGYWNTSSSRLWTRIRDLMHNELVEIYKDMRANGMSYESFMSYFYDQQIAQIPQKYYNMDADVKYLPFADAYIGKAHGDGYEHLKRWLKKRLIFTDTLYDYEPSYNNDVLTIRANTTELMTLEIETYTPVYQHLSWYNGQMDKKKIDGKIAMTFTGHAQAATDQEILIYGGSNIKSIRGISTTNPSQLLIGSATRLTELELKNCPLLVDINSNGANLLPHAYLTKIDFERCTALSGNLNIQNSRLIQHINMNGCDIIGVNFPSSAKNLKYISFRDCMQLKNLDLSNISIKDMTDMSYMFYNCNSLTSLDLSKFDTSNVTNMESMFNGCNSLTSINLSSFDTSNLTNMYAMFAYCRALTELDVTNFDTSNVTNMQSVFRDCITLTELDVSNFSTSNVTNMSYMFYNCNNLISLDVSKFNTSNVTNMYGMFTYCEALTSLDVTNFDTFDVTSMSDMFAYCEALTELDVANFDTSNVISMYGMFQNCNNLTSLDLSNFDTSNVTSIGAMFYNCNNLISLDLSNFDTSKVTDMGGMFYNCNNLTSLDISKFVTSNVTNMNNMFNGCNKLTELDITKFDTSKVTDMGGMFAYCTDLIELDVTNFDTFDVTSMSDMFAYCEALTELDVANFDTSNVTIMSSMFYNCNNLTSLDISKFVTSNVTNMNNMFNGCNKLTELDITKFNTSKVTNMYSMFNNCISLTKLDVSSFNTSNVTNMGYMFNGCNKLTLLDVTKFDTFKVTSMLNMFSGCNNLTKLDVSSFNTSNVTNMGYMFNGCNTLTSLSLTSFDTSNVTNMGFIFNNCSNLIDIEPPKNIFISHSLSSMTKLSREEVVQWLNALSRIESNQTITLGSTLRNKLTESDILIAINKGWNVA